MLREGEDWEGAGGCDRWWDVHVRVGLVWKP